MPFTIVAATCTGCSACEPECPNSAIRESGRAYRIDPALCTECIGHYDDPQCVAVCPVELTVVPDTSVPRYLENLSCA